MTAADIAIVIGAIGSFIVLVGNFAMQVASFIRQGRMAAKQSEMGVVINSTHGMVDGLAMRKDAAIEKAAHEEGRAQGKAEGEQAAAAAIELAKTAIAKTPDGAPLK